MFAVRCAVLHASPARTGMVPSAAAVGEAFSSPDVASMFVVIALTCILPAVYTFWDFFETCVQTVE